jgi:PAS domain S-box-containing protein
MEENAMNKKRILVVEDERLIAEDIKRTLNKLGYEVTDTVISGKNALLSIEADRPDLVLMDIVLSGEMNGITVAEKIRNNYRIPVVYLTAYADQSTLERAKQTEPYGYILKPFSNREILTIIEIAIFKHNIEMKLIESEEKFRDLFESANDIIAIIDGDGNIIDINQRAADITGFLISEVRTWNIYSDLIIPDDLDKFRDAIRQINEGQTQACELRWRRQDDNIIVLEATLSPRFMPDGSLNSIRCIFRDITRRKQAEENIAKYQELLKALASQLSKVEEIERHHIATELHDNIGQNLTYCTIKLGGIMQGITSTDLEKSIRDVRDVIDQTIQYTRSLTFELSPPILFEIGLKAAIEWLGEHFGAKYGLQVYIISSEDSIELDDENRALLFQAVRELLTNVAKHAQAQEAEIILSKKGRNLHISVKDNGIGFDTSMLRQYDIIMGFGLFNIRTRLESAGGHMDIESAPGKGTRVDMTLPLQ